LRNHNDTGCLRGATDTGDSEQLSKTSKEVGIGGQARLFNQNFFLSKKSVSVVKISSSLDGVLAKAQE
jgi:hypothetical protein